MLRIVLNIVGGRRPVDRFGVRLSRLAGAMLPIPATGGTSAVIDDMRAGRC